MLRSVWLGIPILALLLEPAGSHALEIGGIAAMPRFVASPPGFEMACEHYRWLCIGESAGATGLSDGAIRGLAGTVNRDVNREVEQRSDREMYGVAEKWTLPAAGRGDCEDLALEKMRRLLDHGVPAGRLSMAIVLDRDGDNHAILLLRLDGGELVLDSLTDRMVEPAATGYRMLAMQASEDRSRWKVVATRAIAHISPDAPQTIDAAAGTTTPSRPDR
jgi:predicted transglutaminase-like cysteine proteinase